METETQIEESERLAPNAQEQSGSTNNSDDGASSNPASTENSDSTAAYTHSTNNTTADGSTITAVDSSLPASPAASNSFLATNANSPPVPLQPSTIPIEEVGYNIHEETTNPRPGQNAIGRPPIQESLACSENDERGLIVPMPV
jgi:hypothetical protein